MTFEDLVFERRFPEMPGSEWGVRSRVFFRNGYGVSVIRGRGTYGAEQGLYELAVLRGNPDECEIAYDTPITDGVEGYLTPKRVTEFLAQIEALPNVEGAE